MTPLAAVADSAAVDAPDATGHLAATPADKRGGCLATRSQHEDAAPLPASIPASLSPPLP